MPKFLVLLFVLLPYSISASDIRKSIKAVRIDDDAVVKIDGILDEEIWKQISFATDFTIYSPDPGKPSAQRSEVIVLYDNSAIYIGARLFDKEPGKILTQLALRDEGQNNADHFLIAFDTYNNGQYASAFGVSASGVQTDYKMTPNGDDYSWNAVWESEVTINDLGWFVEIRIPYSALRFPDIQSHTWGLNIERIIRRTREASTWNPIDRDQSSVVTQLGTISGIDSIEAPLRLSVTPYVSAYLEHFPHNIEGKSNYSWSLRGGMDIKYGLSESFTLDMTLIPDFGQVQSDNEVLNLSPFEVMYDEKRPFFIEGTELFSIGNLFYTRRVGGRPVGFYNVYSSIPEGDKVIENPTESQLINATKLTGRTKEKLGIGVFNAVSARTYANILKPSGEIYKVLTQPLTNYNVLVLDQQLKNNSSVSFVNTNVFREEEFEDANVTGLFWNLKDKALRYSFHGSGVVSLNDIHLDESGETQSGFKYNLGFKKISGRYRFYVGQWVESNTYDINDLGFIYSNNASNTSLGGSYNYNEPVGKIIQHSINLNFTYNRLYKPQTYTSASVDLFYFFLMESHLGWGGNFMVTPVTTYDYYEPRVEGRFVKYPSMFNGGAFISTDYRKAFALDMSVYLERRPDWQETGISTSINPRIRMNDQLSFFPMLYLENYKNNRGFADFGPNDEIIFGRRNVKTISASVLGKYIFNRKMAVSLNLRHYWSEAFYLEFYELTPTGNLNISNLSPDADINFNAFNIDLGYYWEFAPGSELRLVWKNAILQSNQEISEGYFMNLGGTLREQQRNNFSVKVIYYLDYFDAERFVKAKLNQLNTIRFN